MSNRIPLISTQRRPGEQGDIDDVKYNIILTSRAVMASGGPPPPPPPPHPFGGTKPPPPTSPPPSPPPPPRPAGSQLETADKAVQSTGTGFGTHFSEKRAEFARTVHTFFNDHHNHSGSANANANTTSREGTISGAVQTAALIHVEDPEVIVRSLAVPLSLAAPCRSKPSRCSPSPCYERRLASPSGRARGGDRPGRDAAAAAAAASDARSGAASAGAGGDAASIAATIPSTGSSSPCFGLDFADEMRTSGSDIDECPQDTCLESCVYYSVRCCECIVL